MSARPASRHAPAAPRSGARKGLASVAPRRRQRSCRVVESDPERNRARFECSECGHRWWGVLVPKSPIGTLPSVEMRRRLAHYWRDRVTAFCPNCSTITGSER